MKKIHISTLGCKVNQYESASFDTHFKKRGHHSVSADTDADIVVINTCAVTNKAESQSRREIRKALRNNPQAKIIITGCYSQIASKKIVAMQELHNRSVTIVANGDKHLLVERALLGKTPFAPLHNTVPKNSEISPLPVRNFDGRSRAYLRIQDGCNSYCSYCIVPYTRGRSRSLKIAEVIRQAQTFADEGFKEIVITGIHVGCYGTDLNENADISLIMAKLCHTTPHIRYRLSSIEPLEISEELLDVMMENDNFMPHLHIPLQSGNDDILLRMNRRYSTSQFREKIAFCREKIEDIAIGLDILAGFPGETDERFLQALDFVDSLDFTYLHVFPYSKRPGTPAANFSNQIDKGTTTTRVKRLRLLGERKKRLFYQRFIGSSRPTLVENKRAKNGLLKGFTDNYIPVMFAGDDALKRNIVQIKLLQSDCSGIIGEIV